MIVVLAKLSKMNATLFSLNYYLSVLMQKYNCVCSVKLFSQFLSFSFFWASVPQNACSCPWNWGIISFWAMLL